MIILLHSQFNICRTNCICPSPISIHTSHLGITDNLATSFRNSWSGLKRHILLIKPNLAVCTVSINVVKCSLIFILITLVAVNINRNRQMTDFTKPENHFEV